MKNRGHNALKRLNKLPVSKPQRQPTIFFGFLLTFMAWQFVACEKETELYIPKTNPKVTVNCFLIPDETIKVHVSLSNYIYDAQSTPFTNAQVSLSTENTITAILPHDTSGTYTLPGLTPQKGKQYSLKVEVPGYEYVSASTNIPVNVSLDSLNIERGVGTSDQGWPLACANLYFHDVYSQLSYYQYNCYVCPKEGHFDSICLSSFFSYNAAILFDGDENNNIFTNSLFLDQPQKLDLFYEEPSYNFWQEDTMKYIFSAQIYSLSEEMYHFLKSMKRYQENENNIWNQNSPPPVFSNINNGYGIFAGLSYSRVIRRKIVDVEK